MQSMLLVPFLLAPTLAFGQENPLSIESLLQADEGEAEPATPKKKKKKTQGKTRDYRMEVNFRGRMMSVPDFLMDTGFFNDDDDGWAHSQPRPKLGGYGVGLELVVKSGNANGIFYFDWVNSTVKEGYWDDRENPADHLDGEYLVPSKPFGLAGFGANYAYEGHVVRTADTKGAFGLSFLVGAGLGVTFLVGNMERWTAVYEGEDAGTPAYVRYENGMESDGDKKLVPALPYIDINTGVRFNFADRVVLRFEGGLHSIFYYGMAIGIML
jgi:hypothetical protein